jgi:hypothetical protein
VCADTLRMPVDATVAKQRCIDADRATERVAEVTPIFIVEEPGVHSNRNDLTTASNSDSVNGLSADMIEVRQRPVLSTARYA